MDNGSKKPFDYDNEVTDPGVELEQAESGLDVELDLSGSQWMVRKADGREFGPTTLEELRSLASKGMLAEDDRIKKPGRAWVVALKTDELRSYFSSGQLKRSRMRQEQVKRRKRSGGKRGVWVFFLVCCLGAGAYFFISGDQSLPPLERFKQKVTPRKTPDEKKSGYAALLEELRTEKPASAALGQGELISFDMQAVERQIARDQLAIYQSLRRHLTNLLIESPDNMFVAGFLGEVFAHLASHEAAFDLNRRAIVLATEVIGKIPEHPYGYRAKIAAMLTASNFEQAETEIDGALALGGAIAQDYRLSLYKGIALVGMPGRASEAVRVLKDVIASYPHASAAVSWLADAYLQVGDLYSARKATQARLKIDSDHPRSLTQLGFFSELAGNSSRAVEYYQRALKGRPGFVLPRLLLSFIYYQKQSKVTAAERNLREAIERYSSESTASDKKFAYYHLCNINFLQANVSEATKNCDEALKISAFFFPALIRKSQIALDRGDVDGAVAAMEKAAKAYPDVIDVNVQLATVYRAANRPHDSSRVLTDYLSRHSRSFPALMHLMHSYVAQGKLEEANHLLGKHLGDVWFDAKPLFFSNPFLFIEGVRWEQFVQSLTRLMREVDVSAATYTALGLIKLRQGQLMVSRQHFVDAIKADESFLPAHIGSALMYLSTGDYKQVFDIVDRLPATWKNTTFGKQVFFESLLGLGEIDRAESLIEKVQLLDPEKDCQSVVNLARIDVLRGRPAKHRDKLFYCAGERVYFRPAIEQVVTGKFSEAKI